MSKPIPVHWYSHPHRAHAASLESIWALCGEIADRRGGLGVKVYRNEVDDVPENACQACVSILAESEKVCQECGQQISTGSRCGRCARRPDN